MEQTTHSTARRRARARRRKRHRQGCLIALLCCLALAAALWLRPGSGNALPVLHSRSAVLMDAASGEVLAALRPREPAPTASLTKLMTVYAAMELLPDPSAPVTVAEEMFPLLYAQNASMAGLLPGETTTVGDLWYGALLRSGAECCQALGAAVGGEEVLLQAMNGTADELGMSRTCFKNLTGLHAEGHVSTVEDMAQLLTAALKSEAFRAVFTAWQHTLAGDLHPEGLAVESTLSRYADALSGDGWRVLGGKTGYTDEAGLCLATLAEVNGREYLLVTAGAPGDHTTEPYHVQDAAAVYRWLNAGL